MFWLVGPRVVGRAVVVHYRDENVPSLSGVVWGVRGRWMVLRGTKAHRPNADPVPVDGDVLVPREAIAFVQALP